MRLLDDLRTVACESASAVFTAEAMLRILDYAITTNGHTTWSAVRAAGQGSWTATAEDYKIFLLCRDWLRAMVASMSREKAKAVARYLAVVGFPG